MYAAQQGDSDGLVFVYVCVFMLIGLLAMAPFVIRAAQAVVAWFVALWQSLVLTVSFLVYWMESMVVGALLTVASQYRAISMLVSNGVSVANRLFWEINSGNTDAFISYLAYSFFECNAMLPGPPNTSPFAPTNSTSPGAETAVWFCMLFHLIFRYGTTI